MAQIKISSKSSILFQSHSAICTEDIAALAISSSWLSHFAGGYDGSFMLPRPYSLLRILTGMNKGQRFWSAEYLQCLASLILKQLLRVCVKLNKLLDDVVDFIVVPCIHIQGLFLVKRRNCSRNRNWFFLSFVSVPVTGLQSCTPHLLFLASGS